MCVVLPFVLITSETRNLADFTILQLVLLSYYCYIVEYTTGPDCPGDMHMTIFVLFHAVDVCDLITSGSIACCQHMMGMPSSHRELQLRQIH